MKFIELTHTLGTKQLFNTSVIIGVYVEGERNTAYTNVVYLHGAGAVTINVKETYEQIKEMLK